MPPCTGNARSGTRGFLLPLKMSATLKPSSLHACRAAERSGDEESEHNSASGGSSPRATALTPLAVEHLTGSVPVAGSFLLRAPVVEQEATNNIRRPPTNFHISPIFTPWQPLNDTPSAYTGFSPRCQQVLFRFSARRPVKYGSALLRSASEAYTESATSGS
jgi:hypothetical protein